MLQTNNVPYVVLGHIVVFDQKFGYVSPQTMKTTTRMRALLYGAITFFAAQPVGAAATEGDLPPE